MTIASDLGLKPLQWATQKASTEELNEALRRLEQSVVWDVKGGCKRGSETLRRAIPIPQPLLASGELFEVKDRHFEMLRLLLSDKTMREGTRVLGSADSVQKEVSYGKMNALLANNNNFGIKEPTSDQLAELKQYAAEYKAANDAIKASPQQDKLDSTQNLRTRLEKIFVAWRQLA